MLRRLAGALAAPVIALALAPAALAAPNYVALGDSYASGPLIPVPLAPYGCLRSSSNYPHLAVLLRPGLELRDRTCSGASTRHMYEAHGVTPGPANPPQLDALDAETALVTLHIGGNDIGFGSLATGCASLTRPTGTVCKQRYVTPSGDQVSQKIAATAPKLAGVIQAIRARAPGARVLVLDYPSIFPDRGGGCWPLLPVAAGDADWLRAKHKELNAMIRSVAAANGAVPVEAYRASVGKDACSPPVLRWVEPLVPMHAGAPLHPNLTGMLGMAQLVVAAAR